MPAQHISERLLAKLQREFREQSDKHCDTIVVTRDRDLRAHYAILEVNDENENTAATFEYGQVVYLFEYSYEAVRLYLEFAYFHEINYVRELSDEVCEELRSLAEEMNCLELIEYLDNARPIDSFDDFVVVDECTAEASPNSTHDDASRDSVENTQENPQETDAIKSLDRMTISAIDKEDVPEKMDAVSAKSTPEKRKLLTTSTISKASSPKKAKECPSPSENMFFTVPASKLATTTAQTTQTTIAKHTVTTTTASIAQAMTPVPKTLLTQKPPISLHTLPANPHPLSALRYAQQCQLCKANFADTKKLAEHVASAHGAKARTERVPSATSTQNTTTNQANPKLTSTSEKKDNNQPNGQSPKNSSTERSIHQVVDSLLNKQSYANGTVDCKIKTPLKATNSPAEEALDVRTPKSKHPGPENKKLLTTPTAPSSNGSNCSPSIMPRERTPQSMKKRGRPKAIDWIDRDQLKITKYFSPNNEHKPTDVVASLNHLVDDLQRTSAKKRLEFASK